jgi:hypothetical protein
LARYEYSNIRATIVAMDEEEHGVLGAFLRHKSPSTVSKYRMLLTGAFMANLYRQFPGNSGIRGNEIGGPDRKARNH